MTLTSTSWKNKADFGRRVRGLARGLWNDSIDFMTFINSLTDVVFRGYEQAWREGASTCGISSAERSTDESRVLDRELQLAFGAALGFADFVEAHKKVDGHLMRTNMNRASIWTNRYSAIVTLAQTTSCSDRKFKWSLGGAIDHCDDCLGYHGRVHRGSVWASVGAQPQSTRLACHGYNCQCRLELTTERATPGRPRRPTG